jgi:autophagy-related protein 5
MDKGTEAQKYVWEGAIPLHLHLHESEVTTLPPPPPALILAPRIGYLHLLAQQIKPFFSGALPPGVDTIWFDYKGLPLKWYIPTGVLFDLLCAEPERPWNLTVHFRGYPANLTPCESEDSVKWSFINSLKEAAYIINGNCKNIMNMSQPDQVELWQSVLNGNLESYLRVSSKLKLGIFSDDFSVKSTASPKSLQTVNETESAGTAVKTGRIPVRLYVWSTNEDFEDLEDAPHFDSWDKITYINRPVEIHGEGTGFTLKDAVKYLVPEFFTDKSPVEQENCDTETKISEKIDSNLESCNIPDNAEIKLIRIHGIEPKLEIPFGWVVNNLMNPEHYLHIIVYVKIAEPVTI